MTPMIAGHDYKAKGKEEQRGLTCEQEAPDTQAVLCHYQGADDKQGVQLEVC